MAVERHRTIMEDLDGNPDDTYVAGQANDVQVVFDPGDAGPVDDDTVVRRSSSVVEPNDDDVSVTIVDDDLPEQTRGQAAETYDPSAVEIEIGDAAAPGPSSQENYVAQLIESRRENAQLLVDNLTGKQEQLQAKYEAAKAGMHAAIEAGNTADQVKASEDMVDCKAKLIDTETRLEDAKASLSSAPQVVNPYLNNWMGKNEWYAKPEHRDKANLVRQIDHELAGEKLNPYTPGYFQELNRRLVAKAPTLFKTKAVAGTGQRSNKPPTPQQPTRPPVAAVRPAAGTGKRGRNTVELTKADLNNMREFGLDTTNKDHLIRYAKSKRESK